jgi:uncharacterized cupin superfamily protein
MVDEARLEAVDSGLVPASDGWFVVNARDAAWLTNDVFGARCIFEADVPLVRGTELDPHRFAQLGIRLTVIEPGQPSTLYHAESNQEGFLVLAGECLAIIEDQERHLHAWDFVHCPSGTRHAFVGAGDGPCVILATGARTEDGTIVYPRSEAAGRHGASVETETNSPAEAYARFPHMQRGRPGFWDTLPWSE